MSVTKKSKSDLPLIALVISNIIPIAGVIFWGWDVFLLWLLYWSETLLLMVEGMFKLFFVKTKDRTECVLTVIFGLIMIWALFGLMGLYGSMVLVIFDKVEKAYFLQQRSWFHVLLIRLPDVIAYTYTVAPLSAKLVLISFFISHMISAVWISLKKGTEKLFNFNESIIKPGWNIFIMQPAVFGGFLLAMKLGSAKPFLVMFIVLKILLDIVINRGVLFAKK